MWTGALVSKMAMSEAPGAARACARCHNVGSLAITTAPLERCATCGFVQPRSGIVAPPNARYGLVSLARLAPEGLVRGKYRLIRQLGAGAHGVAYLARHVFLNHPCVVKVLTPFAPGPVGGTVDRVRAEARAGFRVQDPHVVRVLDCDASEGTWYFVMEFIDGANLATVLAERVALVWQQGLQIALDAARGLAAIHRAGLAHRDIKPGNLILGVDGRLRIADLGVAALATDQKELRGRAGSGFGTFAYAAPEFFQPGVAQGVAADLYSLGATLFHLLTGRLPHGDGQVFRRLVDMQCRTPTWPTDAATDTPVWLVDAILRLLAIEPGRRFTDATELVTTLEASTHASRRASVTGDTAIRDRLVPRGIGVLPLRNKAATDGVDWIGHAVANFLGRALAEMPNVYVADPDALIAMLDRVADTGVVPTDAERLEAGRMCGARTVVSGSFEQHGDELEIELRALRGGGLTPVVARVLGPIGTLAALERRALHELAARLGLVLPAPGHIVPTALDAREKLAHAKRAFLLGEYAQARTLSNEALAVEPEFLEAIGFLGVCLARLGRYDEAEAQHRRQELLAQQAGDVRREIEALANLGVMYYFRGNYAAAQGYYERAAARATAHHLATELAQVSNNLGFVLFRLGQAGEAEAAFSRAIETHRAYGGLASLVGPYNGMGNVLVAAERYAEARKYYRRALALAQEIGDRTSVGTTHMHLGRCAALEGMFDEAKVEFAMALTALEETRFWNGLTRVYEHIAEMQMQLENYEEAARCADKRIELARQHANTRLEAAAWTQKAEALRRAGRPQDAAVCLAQVESGEAAAG